MGYKVEVDVSCPRGGCGLIRGLQGKKLSSPVVLDSGVPVLRVQPSSVFCVRLPENIFAPVAEIRLGKVDKKSRFFSTFFAHPCSFMRFRDPMAIILRCLLELVFKRHDGSMRVRKGQVGSRTPVDS